MVLVNVQITPILRLTHPAWGIFVLDQFIPGAYPKFDVFRVRFLDACAVRQMDFPSIDIDCIFLKYISFS